MKIIITYNKRRLQMATKKDGEKKVCSCCKEKLDDDMFYKNTCQDDKLSNECKICVRKRQKNGAGIRIEQLFLKIKGVCEVINTTLKTPKFPLDTTIITIDTLQDRKVTIEIPINKNVFVTNSEQLIDLVISEITALQDMQVELKLLLGRPVIVITGIVKIGQET